jgi:hypothetical protein
MLDACSSLEGDLYVFISHRAWLEVIHGTIYSSSTERKGIRIMVIIVQVAVAALNTIQASEGAIEQVFL